MTMKRPTEACATAGSMPTSDALAARRRESPHQEWLLDEALKETFPASDPISPALEPEQRDRQRSVP